MYQRLHPRFVQLTPDQLQRLMYEYITDVDSFQNLASELYNIAPNEFHKNYQSVIRGEGLDILKELKDFYIKYFGPVPGYNLKKYTYSNYNQGLLAALNDAIERIRINRETMLKLSGQSEYSDIATLYHDSTIRGLEVLNLITTLYNQTL